MLMRRLWGCVTLAAAFVVMACSETSTPQASAALAIAEVTARENRFPDYPRAGGTYLSFNQAHGFQVNYLASGGKAWLWYPGNTSVVAEEWKLDTVAGQRAICWRHPSNSYNPVTRKSGGAFACQSLSLSQKGIVASLKGNPFKLGPGSVPYRLGRCAAPEAFVFDRKRFSCR